MSWILSGPAYNNKKWVLIYLHPGYTFAVRMRQLKLFCHGSGASPYTDWHACMRAQSSLEVARTGLLDGMADESGD